MKKQLLLFLLLLMPMAANADKSGTCGDNLTWTYVEATKTLTISGSGEMNDYSSNSRAPWYSYRGQIQTAVIESGVTTIGNNAFYECYRLTSINIPNSVTSIGYYAFQNCSSLTTITIPNSVTSIGECSFFCCNALASIMVEDGNPNYDSRNNCNGIVETVSNTLIAGCRTTDIPNSVTSIGEYAFYKCSMTSITIPNSVTSIGNYAFSNCSSLTSITIPNSVTSIGNYAFYDCI